MLDMVAKGWSFHISDVAIAEIVDARESGRLKESEWQTAVPKIDRLVGKFFPCLPGKKELFALCGMRDKDSKDNVIFGPS